MQWQQYVKGNPGGYVQWADKALAAAWFARAQFLTSASLQAQAETGGIVAQVKGINEAAQAVAYGYQALDLRPPSDPSYRAIIARRYGKLTQANLADARAGHLGPAATWAGPWNDWVDTEAAFRVPGAVMTELQRVWGQLGKPPFALATSIGGAFSAGAQVRLYLNELAGIEGACVGDPSALGSACAEWARGFARPVGCAPYRDIGTRVEGCDTYDWNTVSWNDGRGANRPFFLHPLEWSWAFLRELASACATRTPTQIIEQAHTFAAIQNLTILAKARRLPGGAALAGLDEVLRATATAQAAAANKQEADKQAMLAAVDVGFGLAAAAAAPIVPPIGTIVGGAIAAIGGLVHLVETLVPLPDLVSVSDEDDLGRLFPAFETCPISGRAGIGAANQPTQIVPSPPGYVELASPQNCPPVPAGLTAEQGLAWRSGHAGCPFPDEYQYALGAGQQMGSDKTLDGTKGAGSTGSSEGLSTGAKVAIVVTVAGIAGVGLWAATRR